IGVGVSSVTAPIYISEISPADKRGRLVGLFQFNIVLGILVSYLSNYLIGQGGENSWRGMLGVRAFPAAVFYILIHSVPHSPRWLLLYRKSQAAALHIRQKINPSHYNDELAAILTSAKATNDKGTRPSLFGRKYRFPGLLAILFAV